MSFSDYIAERMCERKAIQEKRGLPALYRDDKFWSEFHRGQNYICGKLKNEFGKEAIFAALKRKDLDWCFSLMSGKVRAAICEESRKIKLKQNIVVEEVEKKIEQLKERAAEPAPSPSNVSSRRSSGLSKLDD